MTASPTFEELISTDIAISGGAHAWPTFDELLSIDIEISEGDALALSRAEFGTNDVADDVPRVSLVGGLGSSLAGIARRISARLH
jgi:hypothetical protein